MTTNSMRNKIHLVYTGIATALTIAMFFMTFARILTETGQEEHIRYYEKTAYLAMLIMLTTSSICAMFAHKSPFLMARVCILSALLYLGFQIWLTVDFFMYKDHMTFSISMVFPIVAAILNGMAARSALVDALSTTAIKSLKSKKKRK